MRIFRHKSSDLMTIVCGEIYHTESNYSKKGFHVQVELEYKNFWRGDRGFSDITIYSPDKEKNLYFDDEYFDTENEYTNDYDMYMQIMESIFDTSPIRVRIM